MKHLLRIMFARRRSRKIGIWGIKCCKTAQDLSSQRQLSLNAVKTAGGKVHRVSPFFVFSSRSWNNFRQGFINSNTFKMGRGRLASGYTTSEALKEYVRPKLSPRSCRVQTYNYMYRGSHCWECGDMDSQGINFSVHIYSCARKGWKWRTLFPFPEKFRSMAFLYCKPLCNGLAQSLCGRGRSIHTSSSQYPLAQDITGCSVKCRVGHVGVRHYKI